MSSETNATVTIDGSLATVTISTPCGGAVVPCGGAVVPCGGAVEGGLNVMSTAAIRRLGEAIEQVRVNKDVRFTVVRAEGKVFVAGADIKEMAGYDPAAAQAFGELGSSVCDAIEGLPSITVAALQGAALGGGCELALACDFRVATSQVKIGLPETTLGLLPGWGGVRRAARLLGPSVAKRLIFSGAAIPAEQAKSMGLIDEVVSDAAALDEAISDWRAFCAKGSPAAIALVKRALRDGKDIAAFADCFRSGESREGMTAFIEKRPALWAKG